MWDSYAVFRATARGLPGTNYVRLGLYTDSAAQVGYCVIYMLVSDSNAQARILAASVQ